MFRIGFGYDAHGLKEGRKLVLPALEHGEAPPCDAETVVPLEELERLEQLRALEAGMSIGVVVVERAERGVDTLDDARIVEQRMRELGLGS